MVHRSFTPHVLFIFLCLSVVLLSHEQDNIPSRDVLASVIMAAAVVVGLVVANGGVRITKSLDGKKPFLSTQPESFRRASSVLMQLEVIWTLILPWTLLILENNNFDLAHNKNLTVAHLVAPHLFFFQIQILLELALMVAHCDAWTIFLYTAVANAYRALPLGTGILRSFFAVGSGNMVSATDWLIVIVLPSVASCLWLYSTLIFLPLEWYPVVVSSMGGRANEETAKF